MQNSTVSETAEFHAAVVSANMFMMKRAYYDSSVSDFRAADRNQVLGGLAASHGFALDPQQRNAWLGQIDHLQIALKGLDGYLVFELSIPRMGKRADVVLFLDGLLGLCVQSQPKTKGYLLSDRRAE